MRKKRSQNSQQQSQKKTTYRFDPILSAKELYIGKQVFFKYNNSYKKYHQHEVRKRILLKDYDIPAFDFMHGRHKDETEQEYEDYRQWLKNRIKNGELYERTEQYTDDLPASGGEDSSPNDEGTLFEERDNSTDT